MNLDIILVGMGKMGGSLEKYLQGKKDIKIVDRVFRKSEIHKIAAYKGHKKEKPLIIDFTNPNSVNDNITKYDNLDLDFIVGTTGVDERLKKITGSKNIRLIDSNMALPIVDLFQVFEQIATEKYFCSLSIIESHQKGKEDPSGTAIKALNLFRDKLYIEPLDLSKYNKERYSDLGPIRCIRNSRNHHAMHKYLFIGPLPEDKKNFLLEWKEKWSAKYDKDYFSCDAFSNQDFLVVYHKVYDKRIYLDGIYEAIRFIEKLKEKSETLHNTYSMSNLL